MLEDTVRQIFGEVEKRPEKADRLSKVMDYYLPTVDKLLKTYAEYDQSGFSGQNVVNAKAEIASSLDMMNEGFRTVLNDLFEEDSVGISADISAMKFMFEQDGLTKGKNSLR